MFYQSVELVFGVDGATIPPFFLQEQQQASVKKHKSYTPYLFIFLLSFLSPHQLGGRGGGPKKKKKRGGKNVLFLPIFLHRLFIIFIS